MKKIITVCLPFCILAASCGGGGGDSSTSQTDQGSSVSEPTPPNPNPLGLDPAPAFIPSARQVTFSDCVPAINDYLVGDKGVDMIEDYDHQSKQIISFKTADMTITGITPTTVLGKSGVIIDTFMPAFGTPPRGRSFENHSSSILVPGSLEGGTVSKNYNSIGSQPYLLALLTVTQTSLETFPFYDTEPLKLGDFVTDTFHVREESIDSPIYEGDSTVRTTFIGIDEGTQVIGGVFPYTCVFRRAISDAQGQTVFEDVYTHRWGIAKRISYPPAQAMEPPLTTQMVSATAYTRRKNKTE